VTTPARNRHTTRLPGYDYTQPGAYFVTLLTWHREQTLGEIISGEIQLSKLGKIAASEWLRLESRFSNVKLDEWIIMPNHIHGILMLLPAGYVGARQNPQDHVLESSASPLQTVSQPAQPKGTVHQSLGAILGAFKASVSNKAHHILDNPKIPIWQRNYHEHVIRNETDLQTIRQYIHDNPSKWEFDEENQP